MPVLLGLSSAATYGAADYFGGLAARRGPVGPVVLVSQAVGLLAGVALLAVVGFDGTLRGGDAAKAAGAGLLGLAGLTSLYRGLAVGRMGLVGPVSALAVAAVPVLWGIGTGEDPSGLNTVGIVLAVAAVGLVTRERTAPGEERSATLVPVLYALGAGVPFGFVFVLFGETAPDSGYWPLLVARVVTVTAFAAGRLVARRPLSPGRDRAPVVAATGVLDLAGNVFFLVAVRREAMSVVAPVAALYPAGTVLLARLFLDERMNRLQVAGFLLALPALALLSL